MIVYLKYFSLWLIFMVIIAGITLIVPKLSKKIDKWRAEKKAQLKREEELLQPLEPPAFDESEETDKAPSENNAE